MPTKINSDRFSQEEINRIYRLAKRWGKEISKHAFGEDGPGLDVNLTAMEDVAVAAARGLTDGAVESMFEEQAEHLPDEAPCPTCGGLCEVKAPDEGRTILVRGGAPELNEPICHCSACRRDFFPSTHCVAN